MWGVAALGGKMKKRLTFLQILLVAILILMAIVEIAVINFILPAKNLTKTEMFKTELEDSKQMVADLRGNEGEYVFLSLPVAYEGWEIIEKFNFYFGFRENENGVEIIVGNHDGSKTAEVIFKRAVNARVIQMGYEYNPEEKILIENNSEYLMFEIDGVTYAIDPDLNVWEEK